MPVAPGAASESARSATPLDIIRPLPRTLYEDPIRYSMYDFRRQDERDDSSFYTEPRFVQHLDAGAVARLTDYYAGVVAPGSRVLDLCCSWTSHLPADLQLQRCVGVGLNEQELEANNLLTEHLVRDLNARPVLGELLDASMDAVICNVSVDYLVRPVKVLGEARRILRHGGTAHLAFSNRCFPTKVIGKWLRMGDEERCRWVGGYFWADNEGVSTDSMRSWATDKTDHSDWVDVEEVVLNNEGGDDDPLFVVRATKRSGIDVA